jgi:hypothetical protein
MLRAVKRGARRVWPLGLQALGLVVSLTVLPSLCHASPPDPTWIAGLYDDADHDDVVVEVVGMVAAPSAEPPRALEPVAVGTVPVLVARWTPVRRGLLARLDRAPPLV